MKNVKVEKKQVLDLEVNEQGEATITPDHLDQLVTQLKAFLNEKKHRNLPNPTSKVEMASVSVTAVSYIKNIIYITKGLIEAQEIESDTYGFLTGTVTTFGKWNNIINKEYITSAKKVLEKQEEALKTKEDASAFSEVETAAIAAEPTSEEDQKIEVRSKKNQRFLFDKVNYTLTYMCKGSEKTINLIPKGSWRSTVLSWLVKTAEWIKEKYNDFTDRCIGLKQSLRFKWEQFKYNRKTKKDSSENTEPLFSDLPPNVT